MSAVVWLCTAKVIAVALYCDVIVLYNEVARGVFEQDVMDSIGRGNSRFHILDGTRGSEPQAGVFRLNRDITQLTLVIKHTLSVISVWLDVGGLVSDDLAV